MVAWTIFASVQPVQTEPSTFFALINGDSNVSLLSADLHGVMVGAAVLVIGMAAGVAVVWGDRLLRQWSREKAAQTEHLVGK